VTRRNPTMRSTLGKPENLRKNLTDFPPMPPESSCRSSSTFYWSDATISFVVDGRWS